jgi:hypothetical protein
MVLSAPGMYMQRTLFTCPGRSLCFGITRIRAAGRRTVVFVPDFPLPSLRHTLTTLTHPPMPIYMDMDTWRTTHHHHHQQYPCRVPPTRYVVTRVRSVHGFFSEFFTRNPHQNPYSAHSVNPNTEDTFHVSPSSVSHVLRLTSAFRFPSANTEFITQLSLSLTRNILAWTDFAGSLSRWSDPIPSSSPSPVTSTHMSTLTRPDGPVRQTPTPTLFDDEAVGHTSRQ